MGLVWNNNKGLVMDYPEETARISDVLIEPGRPEASVKLAPLSAGEVERLLKKLDTLAMQTMSPAIATIVTEETEAIIVAIRMCKTETKEDFMGLLSAGSNLDICWLRAQHIGSGLLMTEIADGAHGVWAQAEKTRTWLKTVVAGTEIDLVPPQTSKEEAAIIHLGTIDPIEVPKLDAIRFYIAGIPTPAQSLEYRIRDTFDANDCPICRFEKPIIIGPEKKQQIRVYPYASGDDKTQLLSFLITKAEDLLLTVT